MFAARTFDVTPGMPGDFPKLLQDEDRRRKEVLKQAKASLD